MIDLWSLFKNSLFVIVFIFTFIFPKNIYAHPNVMLEYRIFFKLDNYQVKSIGESWVFDKITSKELMQKYKIKDSKLNKKQSTELAKKIMEGLYDVRYFTYISVDSEDIGRVKASNFKAQIKDKTLSIAFNINLPNPINLKANNLSVEVKDPDASVTTVLAHKKPVILIGTEKNSCQISIKQKNNPMKDILSKKDIFMTAMAFPLKKVTISCK